MDYEQMIDQVRELDFVGDREKADATIKAVWGVIASAVDEDTAQELTGNLPDPLTLEKLRGHQVRPTRIRPDEFVTEMSRQFRLTEEQARQLIDRVLEVGKHALPEETIADLKEALAPGMKQLV
jgi:uncharacterized protein (DUF2267 family)